MKTKVKNATLIAALLGGTGVIVNQVQEPCDRVREVLVAMGEDSPLVFDYVTKVAPGYCWLDEELKCSLREDGSICREGRLYGPGIGGDKPCDLSEGEKFKCYSDGEDRGEIAAAVAVKTWLVESNAKVSEKVYKDLDEVIHGGSK